MVNGSPQCACPSNFRGESCQIRMFMYYIITWLNINYLHNSNLKYNFFFLQNQINAVDQEKILHVHEQKIVYQM